MLGHFLDYVDPPKSGDDGPQDFASAGSRSTSTSRCSTCRTAAATDGRPLSQRSSTRSRTKVVAGLGAPHACISPTTSRRFGSYFGTRLPRGPGSRPGETPGAPSSNFATARDALASRRKMASRGGEILGSAPGPPAVFAAFLEPLAVRLDMLALPLAPRIVPKSPDHGLTAAHRAAPRSPLPPKSQFKLLKRTTTASAPTTPPGSPPRRAPSASPRSRPSRTSWTLRAR